MKKIDKILTYFGDPLCKSRFCFIARGVQLDNGVDPRNLCPILIYYFPDCLIVLVTLINY